MGRTKTRGLEDRQEVTAVTVSVVDSVEVRVHL